MTWTRIGTSEFSTQAAGIIAAVVSTIRFLHVLQVYHINHTTKHVECSPEDISQHLWWVASPGALSMVRWVRAGDAADVHVYTWEK